jgi:hypothetical protein
MVSLFSQTTENEPIITFEINGLIASDASADSTIENLFPYPSAKR